jgi:quercetin dioxygenase-like cupin family protein
VGCMLVMRWQASAFPTIEQIKMIFHAEGLEPVDEVYEPKTKVDEHRHPFDEVRMVVKGQIFYNVAGNRLLLREGDRIIIPSNTKHSTHVEGQAPCISVVASRTF